MERRHVGVPRRTALALITMTALWSGRAVDTATVAGAAPVAHLSCTARASTYRPASFHIETIIVATAPHAHVSGTATSGRSSWPMVPTAAANASGTAWLYQKISAVIIASVIDVRVRVSLHGAVAFCRTSFDPLVYTPGRY